MRDKADQISGENKYEIKDQQNKEMKDQSFCIWIISNTDQDIHQDDQRERSSPRVQCGPTPARVGHSIPQNRGPAQ